MVRVAVVTGSNKGIGLAIVRGLIGTFDGDVFLTARSVERGLAAVEELKKEGLDAKFHQLDIDDRSTIEKFRDFLDENYGGLDLLVNNAGILFPDDPTLQQECLVEAPEGTSKPESEPKPPGSDDLSKQARITVNTNFFGTKAACEILFPLLRDGARVVNMSSDDGFLPKISGKEPEAEKLREKLASSDSTLTIEELSKMMNEFIVAAEAGNYHEQGWPNSSYRVSKVGISTLSRIQQREFNKDPRKDIVVNFPHPGYVITDMTLNLGQLTVEEGAKSALFAALLPPNTEVKGQFIWWDCAIVDWVNGPTPTLF